VDVVHDLVMAVVDDQKRAKRWTHMITSDGAPLAHDIDVTSSLASFPR
jgi:hypothetical protein